MQNLEENASPQASVLVLLAFIFVCLGVSFIGGAITASSVDTWYPALIKPRFTPPDWIFAPVWTTIYLMMAVAAWRVWGQRRRFPFRSALVCFIVQLLLNLAWIALFFGARSIVGGLADISILLLAVAITTGVFFRADRIAGLLMLPYLAWTAFASVLMVELWRLNAL